MITAGPFLVEIRLIKSHPQRVIDVKRLSTKQWLRNIRKSQVGARPGRHARRHLLEVEQVRNFFGAVTRLPVAEPRLLADNRWHDVLEAPETLSLTSNFASTLGFVYAARQLLFCRPTRSTRNPWRLDFAGIRRVGPAAALVLAAELDRWTQLYGRPPRPLIETWQPSVKSVFHDLGLMPLLGLPQIDVPQENDRPSLKFLPFRSGNLTRGQDAERLRADLEGLAGRRIAAPKAIYGALCEAMTNTLQHAYKLPDAAWPAPYHRCWWAAGAYDEESKTLHFFMYDQGVGIPRTLPRSTWWEQIRAGRIEWTDAAMIEGAIELRRSSTSIPGRGRGLDEIVSFIDDEGRGQLRIISGNGEFRYSARGRTSRTLPARLIGTLIEWEIADNV